MAMTPDDLYRNYMNYCNQLSEPDLDALMDDPHLNCLRAFTEIEFEYMLKNNATFNSNWGTYSDNQMSQYLLANVDDMGEHHNNHWMSLTQEQALYIKKLRVTEGHSWRSVSRNFILQYEVQEITSQLMGILLCEGARKVLNEQDNTEW
jgi:hypothetical protein